MKKLLRFLIITGILAGGYYAYKNDLLPKITIETTVDDTKETTPPNLESESTIFSGEDGQSLMTGKNAGIEGGNKKEENIDCSYKGEDLKEKEFFCGMKYEGRIQLGYGQGHGAFGGSKFIGEINMNILYTKNKDKISFYMTDKEIKSIPHPEIKECLSCMYPVIFSKEREKEKVLEIAERSTEKSINIKIQEIIVSRHGELSFRVREELEEETNGVRIELPKIGLNLKEKIQEKNINLIGVLGSGKGEDTITRITVTSCKENFSDEYDEPYTLKEYKYPNFSYVISEDYDNVCEIPYIITFYTKNVEEEKIYDQMTYFSKNISIFKNKTTDISTIDKELTELIESYDVFSKEISEIDPFVREIKDEIANKINSILKEYSITEEVYLSKKIGFYLSGHKISKNSLNDLFLKGKIGSYIKDEEYTIYGDIIRPVLVGEKEKYIAAFEGLGYMIYDEKEVANIRENECAIFPNARLCGSKKLNEDVKVIYGFEMGYQFEGGNNVAEKFYIINKKGFITVLSKIFFPQKAEKLEGFGLIDFGTESRRKFKEKLKTIIEEELQNPSEDVLSEFSNREELANSITAIE